MIIIHIFNMKKLFLTIILVLFLSSIVFATDYFTSTFESGNLTEWSGGSETNGTGNTIAADADAANTGSYGCKVVIASAGKARVWKDLGSDKSEIYYRFYIKWSSVSMGNGEIFNLVNSWNSSWGDCVQIRFGYSTTEYYIWARQELDSGNVKLPGYLSSGYDITSEVEDGEWHCIEYHFKAGTGANGIIELFVDGVDVAGGTDNYDMDTKRFEHLTLGTDGTDANTTATLYFDDVIISDTYNGPTSSIKTINGLAKASVKTINGLAIGSVKTWNGLE